VEAALTERATEFHNMVDAAESRAARSVQHSAQGHGKSKSTH
jgi:hypothetical protein